jgi:hypothetical protein
MMASRRQHGKVNAGYASMAIATANQRAHEVGAVHEKFRLELFSGHNRRLRQPQSFLRHGGLGPPTLRWPLRDIVQSVEDGLEDDRNRPGSHIPGLRSCNQRVSKYSNSPPPGPRAQRTDSGPAEPFSSKKVTDTILKCRAIIGP